MLCGCCPMTERSGNLGLGTGMDAEVHLHAMGTTAFTCSSLICLIPRYHPGSQSLEISQDARETLQPLSPKIGKHSQRCHHHPG